MNDLVIKKIAQHYNLNIIKYEVISSGLINATVKLITNNDSFILQKINTSIFNNPQAIHDNIFLLDNYLQQNKQSYTLTVPVIAQNKSLVQIAQDTYRLFHFIPDTYTIATVSNVNQAYEAAKQFSNFTHQFIKVDCNKLHIILPDFHHLSLRFQQFLMALKTGNKNRIEANKKLIDEILNHENICKKYEYFVQSNQAIKRVTHHDTKISNVLFNQLQKAVCVIDLDTVMPGFFISDVGDMIRTYVCPVAEEESDLNKIFIRADVLQAIYEGYVEIMHNNLTAFELNHFFFSGEVLVYMQAIRFLTDYFLNDIYYTTHYAEQNLVRTKNQLQLLKALQASINNLPFHLYKK